MLAEPQVHPVPQDPGQPSISLPRSETPAPPEQAKALVVHPSFFRSTQGTRASLTIVERENQLLAYLKHVGGIAESDMGLVRSYGDQISSQEQARRSGKMDRKTVNSTLDGLQARGDIRRVTILVPDALGRSHRRQIAMLSSISPSSAQALAFFKSLQIAKLRAGPAMGSVWGRRNYADLEINRPARAKPAAKQPKFLDDMDEIKETIAREWRIVAQSNGFEYGRFARARTLHVFLLDLFARSPSDKTSILCNEPGKPRLFTSGLFVHDLTLEVFSRIVPLAESEAYRDFAGQPGAMQTRLSAVPLEIRRHLRLGQLFPRRKILNVVEVLWQMRLLTPLTSSLEPTNLSIEFDGNKVYYKSIESGIDATVFHLAGEGGVYRFHHNDGNVPLLQLHSLSDGAAGREFWHAVRSAAIPQSGEAPPPQDPQCEGRLFSHTSALPPNGITKQGKWQSRLDLFTSQKLALVHIMQHAAPPLDADGDDERIDEISRTVLAPPESVVAFITRQTRRRQNRLAKAAELARNRHRAVSAHQGGEGAEGVPPSLSKRELALLLTAKAAAARAQREGDFSGLISRFKQVHNVSDIDEGEVMRLHEGFVGKHGSRQLNAAEVEAGLKLWLERSQGVVSECSIQQLGAAKRLQKSLQAKLAQRPSRPVGAIALQAIKPQQQCAGEVGARPEYRDDAVQSGRRRRIVWDDTSIEFLRDLVAIMRARSTAYNVTALQWNIVYSMFGGSGPSLRKRLKILEQNPVEKAYLALLTEAWTEVYLQKRGTPELPEDTSSRRADFNAGLALDILRANIDKSVLWMEAENASAPAVDVLKLPASVDDFAFQYKVKHEARASSRGSRRWDALLAPVTTMTKRTELVDSALSYAFMEPPSLCDPLPPEERCEAARAAEAIKMVLSTAPERYSEPLGTQLLARFSEHALDQALAHLSIKGVISRIKSNERRIPGRNFHYGERFWSMFQQSVNDELIKSSHESYKELERQPDAEWPLVPNSADMAALLHAFSDETVSLSIDITQPSEPRNQEDTNTRHLTDAQIEHPVSVVVKGPLQVISAKGGHTGPPSADALHEVESAVINAGAPAISAASLKDALSGQCSGDEVAAAVDALCRAEPPRLHWVGLLSRALVASAHLEAWHPRVAQAPGDAQTAAGGGGALAAPRLWTNVRGEREEAIYAKALGWVKGLIESMPGISASELALRTSKGLTPVELDDALAALLSRGIIDTSPLGDRPGPAYIRGFTDAHFWKAAWA